MEILDLRSPSITVKFNKGATLNPVFFYLTKDAQPIDLTGYTARMQARANPNDVDPIAELTLTTENAGLAIVTGTATLPTGSVANAQGVQLNVPASVTTAFTFRTAVFGIELIAPNGIVTTLVSGRLEPEMEIVR